MKCPFCEYAPPFKAGRADYIIDGISVCENHVDAVSGEGFGKDLYRLQRERKP